MTGKKGVGVGSAGKGHGSAGGWAGGAGCSVAPAVHNLQGR